MGNNSKVNRWAYPIPSNLLPVDDFCAKVYIPNGDDYRRAFLGAYTFFGSWVAWERDREHNATIAAGRWREAMEKTLDSWGDGCAGVPTDEEFCNMTEEEFRLLMQEELNKMAVTIYNTQNCGCGCDGTGGSVAGGGADLTAPDVPIVDPVDYIPPVDVPAGLNPSDQQKCEMANYLVYTIRMALMRMVDHSGNYENFIEYLQSLWGLDVDGVVYQVKNFTFQFYVYVLSKLNGNSTAAGQIAASFDEHFNFYVCQLFQSVDQKDAYERMNINLRNTQPDLIIQMMAVQVAQLLPYHMLFVDAGAVAVPDAWKGRTCCGSVQEEVLPSIPLPEVPNTTYLLMPMKLSAYLAEPTKDGNEIVSFTEYSNRAGAKYTADIMRSATLIRGAVTLLCEFPSRNMIEAEAGTSSWTFLGWVIHQGASTASPDYEIVRSISYASNMALVGTPPWTDNTERAVLIPGTAADEFAAFTDLEVHRYADPNAHVAGANDLRQQMKFIMQSSDDSPYKGTRVSNDMRGMWTLYKVTTMGT